MNTKWRKKRSYVQPILGFLVVFALVFTVVTAQAAGGASLKISPNTGVYEVGSTVDVSFLLDTGGDSVNTVNADIQFPPDKLQVVNPAASTSFISLWVTAPTYSNTDGTLSFAGGLPNPGIKTSAGVISTVTFRVKAAGQATVRYAATSKVLRNDGEGTNILSSTGTATFTLKTPPPAGPVVASPTHSDANQWYNNPTVQFQWEPPNGATGYSTVFDQAAKTVPPDTVSTTTTSTTVKATGDGVWYFHIKAKTADGWGGVTDFPVQIDTTPPANFTPKLDKATMTTDESGTLRWLTTDGASGIDHYEVKQLPKNVNPGENTLFVEASSPYPIPKLPAGQYEYVVRAIDRAGNTTDGSTALTVVAAGVAFYARTPFLRNPAVANAVVVGLTVLVVFALGLIIWRRIRIRATFRHDLTALERDASRKYEDLQRELAELREAKMVLGNEMNPSPSSPTIPPVAAPLSPPPANPPANPPISPSS